MTVAFLFLASFLFSVDAHAQFYPNLVTEGQAQTMLNNELPSLENIMNNLTPGTPAYVVAERKHHMFMHTWELVTTGETLENALTNTYGEFALAANGYKADLDEFTATFKESTVYEDPAFRDLVNFLEQ